METKNRTRIPNNNKNPEISQIYDAQALGLKRGCVLHFIQRLRERYGLELTTFEVAQLRDKIIQIEDVDIILYRGIDSYVFTYMKGVPILVFYDPETSSPVTVMSPTRIYNRQISVVYSRGPRKDYESIFRKFCKETKRYFFEETLNGIPVSELDQRAIFKMSTRDIEKRMSVYGVGRR